MRRFLVFVVLAALAALPAAPAMADDYPPEVPTSCRIEVPTAVVGERVVIRVRVTASSSIPVTGSVVVTVSSRAAADWTTTRRYEGEPLRIVGPRLSRGDHVATVRFTPDSDTFTGCRDAVSFSVGQVGGEQDEDADGGVLPDTGGPRVGLLLGGLALLVAGGGLVVVSRRESVTPGIA